MANYPIPDNPKYVSEIRAIDNDDPVIATDVVNPLIERLVENTHFLRMRTPYEGVISGGPTSLIFIMEDGYTLGDGDLVTGVMPWAIRDGATATVGASGALPIKMPNGDAVTVNAYVTGTYITLQYSAGGNCFFATGGSAAPVLSGTAGVGDVVNGKTFYKDDPKTKLTGAMSLDAMTKYAFINIGNASTVSGLGFVPWIVRATTATVSTSYIGGIALDDIRPTTVYTGRVSGTGQLGGNAAITFDTDSITFTSQGSPIVGYPLCYIWGR